VPETIEHPGIRRVLEAAARKGVALEVTVFDQSTHTAADAAAALNAELGQIVKSLVFDCDGRKVLVLVPGDRRADSEKIARAAGSNFARIAGSDEVREATGFDPGAVAPFPLERIDAIFVERTLLSQPVLWVGAGSERHMAALSPTELLRLSRARPMDVVEQAPYHST
jgi:prolyl-tRNA editing enzyme YbaK/EbsC (Cys-tRNA(Pro) deacylase)